MKTCVGLALGLVVLSGCGLVKSADTEDQAEVAGRRSVGAQAPAPVDVTMVAYQRYKAEAADYLVSTEYREGYDVGYRPNSAKGFSTFNVFDPSKSSATRKTALIRCNLGGKHYVDVLQPGQSQCEEGGSFEGSVGTIWGAQFGADGRSASKALYRCKDSGSGAFYVANGCYGDQSKELLGWQP